MGTEHPWSVRLRQYRQAENLTQEELAELIGVPPNYISAWENGRGISPRSIKRITSRLGITPYELGVVEREPEKMPVDRRQFNYELLGGIGALVMGSWDGLERGVDRLTVEGFERAGESLDRLAYEVGPAGALGPALGHFAAMQRLLKGSIPSALRPKLCRTLAAGSALLSDVKASLDDQDAAEFYADLAFTAAKEAEDEDLAANLLVYHASTQPSMHNQPNLRLRRFTEGDLGISIAAASLPTRTWAATKAADVYAQMGRSDECRRALDDAEIYLAHSDSRAAIPRFSRVPGEPWLAGERGASLARLGRTDDARDALKVALLEPTLTDVERLWLELARMRCSVKDGDVDGAAREGMAIVSAAGKVQHGHLLTQVRQLRREIGSVHTGEVQGLDDLLATVH